MGKNREESVFSPLVTTFVIILLFFLVFRISATIQLNKPLIEKIEISNSKGESITGRMELSGKTLENKSIAQALTARRPAGNYDLELKFEKIPVKKIEFKNADVETIENLRIDDIGKKDSWQQVYAIDPTDVEFENATVTVVAKGSSLYKCADWNFTTQHCDIKAVNCTYDNESQPENCEYTGGWQKLMDMIPGQEYFFTLTQDDPGFAEGSPSLGTADSGYVIDNDGDDEEGGTYADTQSDDNSYYFIGEDSWQNGQTLNSFIILEYDISSLGIASSAIINLEFNITYCHSGDNSNPACDGGTPAEGTPSGDQNFEIYNWTGSSWVDIGNLRTNDGESEVTDSYDVTSGFADYVNSSDWIRVRYEGDYDHGWLQDSWLLIDYAPLTVAYVENDPPTKPNSITCDGGSCNNSFSGDVDLNCSGSTDGDGNEITYVIEGSLNNITTAADTADVSNAGESSKTENVSDVPVSCYDNEYTGGDSYEIYSSWTLPGSGDATLTGLRYWQHDNSLTSAESIEMALYNSTGNRISEIVTLSGTATVSEWVNVSLNTPITITLGNNYFIGVGPDNGGYDAGRDASADCANYLPNEGSYYESSGGGLNDNIPASQTTNKYTFWGVIFEFGSGASYEKNTSYTSYDDINDDYETITNISAKIEVDSYNPEASVQNSNNDPDLELDIYNGSSWVTIGTFNLPDTYTGTGLDTTNYEFILSTTNEGILTAWQTAASQDIRIRGVYIDYYDAATIDEINYTNVWIIINGMTWQGIGNHTETAVLKWDLSGIPDQTNVDLKCRAIDLGGSNTFSNYYDPDINMTITSIDAVSPIINQVNDTPDPVNIGGAINFTANVTDDVTVSQVWIEVNGSNRTMTADGTDIWYYDEFNTSIAAGTYDYTIYANDTAGNNATPKTGNFTVNAFVSISLTNAPINFSSVQAGQTVNASESGWPLQVKNEGNVNINITMKGYNLTGQTNSDYKINVTRVHWDLNKGFAADNILTENYALVGSNVLMGNNISVYYRLYAPYGIIQQDYRGNVTFLAVQS